MKILHYSLGFPPYRTGGMTKFCVDLMRQQERDGHQVALMWPGKIGFVRKEVSIKNRGIAYLDGRSSNIYSFEVINPLPISYDEGISDFQTLTKDAGRAAYSKLLEIYKPKIIHIHTLMGLHKSFLMIIKEKGIRLVFSAHDFFPICPKVTMFRHGAICTCIQSCEKCGVCNTTALGMKKMKLLQSPIYRQLKDSIIVKKLRKQHRDSYLSESTSDNTDIPVGTKKDFKRLRSYYGSLLELMNMIHYNSSITKVVYESIFNLPKNCVIPITHADVTDNRKIKDFSNNCLKIRYLGSYSMGKGFFLLKEALDKLWSEKQDFCLDIHFTPLEMAPYIKIHDRYTYNELESIFDNTDVLVVPSLWYETFGYTTLEALSFGVPVVMSNTVGAKDILTNGAGIVVERITSEKLYMVLRSLSKDKLKEMNQAIVDNQNIMTLEEMSRIIEENCYMRIE